MKIESFFVFSFGFDFVLFFVVVVLVCFLLLLLFFLIFVVVAVAVVVYFFHFEKKFISRNIILQILWWSFWLVESQRSF